MTMNLSICDSDHTRYAEFEILQDCSIPKVVDLSLTSVSIILAAILLLAEPLVLKIFRLDDFKIKSKEVKILTFWCVLVNPIMIIQPLIEVFTEYRSINSLPMSLLTHISPSSVSGLAIMFTYFQVNLLHKSSLTRTNNPLFRYRKIILITIFIIQQCMFIFNPILNYYGILTITQSFWIPVSFVDFTIIPYLCIVSILISIRIKNMQQRKYKKLSRQILITVTSCTLLGMFTGAVGVFASRGQYTIEWILIKLCWISAIAFGGFIFAMIYWSKSRSRSADKSTSTGSTGNTGLSGKKNNKKEMKSTSNSSNNSNSNSNSKNNSKISKKHLNTEISTSTVSTLNVDSNVCTRAFESVIDSKVTIEL